MRVSILARSPLLMALTRLAISKAANPKLAQVTPRDLPVRAQRAAVEASVALRIASPASFQFADR